MIFFNAYDTIFDTSCRTQTITSVSSVRAGYKTISDVNRCRQWNQHYEHDQSSLSDLKFFCDMFDSIRNIWVEKKNIITIYASHTM